MNKFYIAIITVLIFAVMPISGVFAQSQSPTKVIKPAYFDKTKALIDIQPVTPGVRDRSWKNNIIGNKFDFEGKVKVTSGYTGPDPVLQTIGKSSRDTEPTILQNFAGVSNLSGVAPPDTDGDVGPNHYMQMVNMAFAIYDKEGNILYGPADNSTLWDGFVGPWTSTNDGDPIVLYDEYADRWIASQFAILSNSGPWYELIAVSATSDPTGEWYRYAYEFGNMPDYPKFGIWPNGYYFTINQYYPWAGAGICVTDRAAMIAGDPEAELIFWDMGDNFSTIQPADVDGDMLPPEGSPAYMVNLGSSTLRLWEVEVDWDNTDNSKVTYKQAITIAAYNNDGISVKQPGTSTRLATLSDRLMYKLQYRNFGDYEVMLCNHSVNAGGGRAGVRWYELRSENEGSWGIYQQGTYAPDDGESRWMGSIAMNQNGDIAIGYSVSSENTYPSIRVAGQTNGAPEGLGILDIAEVTIKEGNNSQTGVDRWGDYAKMSVDPTDGQTFWFTTEYSTGGWSWRTQIASIGFAQPPVADFVADEILTPVGESIDFSDLTSGIPNTWEWTFEGGDPATSDEQNPEGVLFDTEGSFDITLKSINNLGENTIVKEDYITTSSTILPEVGFESNTDFVCVDGEVFFTDQTIYAPNSWEWTFEPSTVVFVGGSDANSQNPIVTFSEADSYTVTLKAWNLNGSAQLTKESMVIVGGYTPYYTEDFEFDNLKNNNWTIENPDGDVTWGLFETGGTVPGSTSAGINFKEYFTIGERDRLISPQFNLMDLSSAVFEFQHAYAQFIDGFSDSLIVYVSANCSENWTRVYTSGEDGEGSFATHEIVDEFWPSETSDWCMTGWGAGCIVIDLTPWVGQSGVRVAFESYSNFGNPLMIDNVTVSQFVGQEETSIKDNGLVVYPNPASGTFKVVIPDDEDFSELNFVNYMGQVVYSSEIDASVKTIEISTEASWTPGVYFLKVSGKGKTSTKKVILF